MKTVKLRLESPRARCPHCGSAVKRHSLRRRIIYEAYVTYDVEFDYYRCQECKTGFKHPGLYDIALTSSRWGRKLQEAAVEMRSAGKSLEGISRLLSARMHRPVSVTTIHGWLSVKKREARKPIPDVEVLPMDPMMRLRFAKRKVPKLPPDYARVGSRARPYFKNGLAYVESEGQETCPEGAENA